MAPNAVEPDPDIFKQLQDAYANRCGRSPMTLIGLLNDVHSEDLIRLRSNSRYSSARDLISDKTIRTFFNSQIPKRLSTKNLNYLVSALLGYRSYADALEALTVSSRVERVIEFPPEHREAGTSILAYFNHILEVKYPNQKIKVQIEQEGLLLRMIIETPSGHKELVEKTLLEYGMVVTGNMQPEDFIDDPFEVMALKNKLDLANLELQQTKQILELIKGQDHNSQIRISSLEYQVERFFDVLEQGLTSNDSTLGVMRKMSDSRAITQNFNNSNIGNAAATNLGKQQAVQKNYASVQKPLAEAAEIQRVLAKISQIHPIETAADKSLVAAKAVQEIESKPQLKQRILDALKAGGTEAFKELINHPAINIFLAAIEGWQGDI